MSFFGPLKAELLSRWQSLTASAVKEVHDVSVCVEGASLIEILFLNVIMWTTV